MSGGAIKLLSMISTVATSIEEYANEPMSRPLGQWGI
jgi:hypothetical protein